jgi:Fur family ferric uptake transcriptional regulator
MILLDELKKRLREHVQRNGLKSSTRRDLILEALTTLGPHVTADQLLRAVRERDERVGAATVYRTLRILQECDIIVERRFEGGASLYELVDDSHHDHLICVECKCIIEFDDDAVERAQEKVALKFGFELHYHRHELYGLCAKCLKKRGAKPGATAR